MVRLGSRFVIYIGLLVLCYPSFRLIHEHWATAHDLRQFKAPGRLVDVDGIEMHLYCTGSGSPTVVLDAGLGEFSHTWQGLQPDIAAFTRVCSYDRAGYGWSEASPHSRTSQQIADELHILLQAAEEDGPYLLVGHSLGGFHVRVFAKTYPSETAGIVLLDASHENMGERLPGVQRFPQRVIQLRDQARQAKWGTFRGQPVPPLQLGLPAHISPANQRLRRHATYLQTIAAELDVMMSTSANQVRTARNFGDLPVYVISRSPTWRGSEALKTQAGIDVEAIWHSYQQDHTTLSTNTHHIVADTSGHYVHLEAPTLVRNILYEAVQAFRHKTNQLPSVFLNHVNRVLDADTYQSIAESPFIQDLFASNVQTTVNSGGQAWTGLYLFGEHTYLELFASGTGVQRPPSSSALAFGVESPEAGSIIHQRLQAIDTTASHYLRTRTLADAEVPWFYTASRNAQRYTDVIRSWVMEIHPEYLATRFPDLNPAQNGITRHQYLHRIYRPNRLLQDIRHVTVALPSHEFQPLAQELALFGYRLIEDGSTVHAEGPGITVTLLPATPSLQGIVALKFALTRPHTRQATYHLGHSVLQFHDDLTATWVFK